MKNLFTLALASICFSASAQVSVSNQKKKNVICEERGHNVTYSSSSKLYLAPYTIDTKDSTVTVYPVPTASTAKCSRCGAMVESNEKEIRITTWRRSETVSKATEATAKTPVAPTIINWGSNTHRSSNLPLTTSSLNDNKRVASLRNDTLFIYKRIAPFASIREQIREKGDTTVYYKNKPIVFKTAVFDDAFFYNGKNGIDIY